MQGFIFIYSDFLLFSGALCVFAPAAMPACFTVAFVIAQKRIFTKFLAAAVLAVDTLVILANFAACWDRLIISTVGSHVINLLLYPPSLLTINYMDFS